ncbi:MAG: corrinoid protein [Planctomycetota bacterium]|nr:corrinoid protein [Planctomycetota bacterium]
MDTLAELSNKLIEGDDERVGALTQQAIDEDLTPQRILNEGLIAGMTVIGDRFKAHEIFLPDVLMAAKAMYAGMERLKPLLIRDGVPSLGTIVIGTIQGDLHDIGKNLVGIMLRGAGFDVIDLGNDVAPQRFVEAAREHRARLIGLSALLTTTMSGMAQVVDLVREEGLSGRVKIIIGGAPVSEEFARRIGADAYGYDSANAVDLARTLLRETGHEAAS